MPEVPRLIVQLAGDALRLLLQEVVEPAKRGVRLLHAAVRHLEGRQALEQHVLGGLDDLERIVLSVRARRAHRLVDETGDVQDAQS